ncbi:MAG: gliding motility-associated C-terminal domain-containing protein [Saprospiraceae bacterium]
MSKRKSTLPLLFLFILGLFSTFSIAQTPYPDTELCLSNESGEKGDTVCVSFMVKNFTDIEAFTFQISYNRNIVMPLQPVVFSDPRVTDDLKNGLSTVFNFESLGRVLFSYVGNQITYPDDVVLFELCFKILGNPGDSTPIFLNTAFPDSGYVRPEFQEPGSSSVLTPFIVKNGSIKVVAKQITITRSVCDVTNGAANNNGVIEFMVAGGTPPYSYSVTPGSSGTGIMDGQRVRLENLSTGSYTIKVTDVLNVMQSINVVVSDNLPYTHIITGKDPDCSNRDVPNGSAIITINDPGPFNRDDFKYEWSNFVFNTPDNINLSNGIYKVTIIDPSGCRAYDSVEIYRERINVSFQIIQEESCPGQGDGIIRLSITGGLPFSGNKYNIRLNGLPVGNDTTVIDVRGGDGFINVIDSLNCFETIEFFMPTKPGIIVDTLFIKHVTCFNGGDAGFSVRATEVGNTNFQFVLRLSPTNQIILGGISGNDTYTHNNLPEGTYNLRITSTLTGCFVITPIVISQPIPINLTNVSIVNPSCQSNIGSITVLPSGGNGPFTFKWSHNMMATGNSVSGLPPGNYTVTVTDQKNCTEMASFTLIFDGMGTAPVTNDRVVKPISCFGGSDGQITVDVFNQPANTTFTWRKINEIDIISNQQEVSNLSAGTYVVLVSNGTCSVFDTVTLNDPPGMDIMLNITEPTCPGLMDGSIGANVTGGNPNYNYQWFPSGSTTPISINSVLAPIVAGSYDLILIDSKNCRQDTTIILLDPAKIIIDLLEVNRVNCFGLSNGRADVIATGGTVVNPTFNYLWSSSPADSGAAASNLKAGKNWVIAYDNICVSDTLFFDVPTVQKLQLDASTTFVNPSCYNSTDGSIKAVAKGGIGTGYGYLWLTAPGGNDSLLTNIGAGKYLVRISDPTGCFTSDSVTLTQPDSLAIFQNPLATQQLSCRNMDSGQIGVISTGGNPGIVNFRWNYQNQTGAIISGLSAGNYCVTATDSKGCTAEYCTQLTSPPPVQGRMANTVDPPCFGEKTELCVDFITGGTGNKYTFQINQGQRFSTDSCVSIFAGTYTINLIDSAGCFIDTVIVIGQPDPISIDLVDAVDVLLGEKTDLIIPQINSGFGINSIVWTPFEPESIECVTADCAAVVFSPTSTQVFQLLVTDLNNCTAIDEIEVRVKDVRNAFFPNIFNPRNEGGRTGSNNFFNVAIGKGVQEILLLEVYDRWGNKVFGKYNYVPDGTFTDGWDGTFRGNLLDSAVFVYKAEIRFTDGKDLTYTGAITLVR